MKKTIIESRVTLCVVVGIVSVAIGFLTGLLFSHGIIIDSKFTIDGITTALATLIAVVAATIVLPLTIQPLIKKQNGIVTATHEDIKSLLDLIHDVLDLCEKLYLSKKPITEENRQLILSRHKQIHYLADMLKRQSVNMPALASFDADVFMPLNNSHTDFADNVIPGTKMTNQTLLNIRGNLDPIVYKLHEIRYKIH